MKTEEGVHEPKNTRLFLREAYYLRGAIANTTYGTNNNLYISLFLPTIFGPIYYGPPQ